MHLLRHILAFLRELFFLLDLRGRITSVLLTAALAIGTLVTLSAYFLAHHEVSNQTHALLKAEAKLEQREIELRLTSDIALADSIARNTVTANALADSRGRETYLDPLLRNQRLGIEGATLSVVDYRGRTAASNIGNQPPAYGTRSSFTQMMASGLASYEIIEAGTSQGALLIALPIRYRLTGNVEGAVMLHVPLSSLLVKSEWADGIWLSDTSGKKVIGNMPAGKAFEMSTKLQLPAPLEGQLILVLARDRAAALHVVNVLLMIFLGIGLLVVISVVLLAHAGARHITAPLGEIAAAAEEIAASGLAVSRLPVRRADEFGRLSVAFNTMVQRLQESYGELENLVKKRTLDYEQSRQQAETASNLLREAVQRVAVGFTIYDAEDRLVLCNDAYLNLYEDSRDLIVSGRRFEEIIREGAERGQYQEAQGNIDAWVAERVAQHQNADGRAIEQHLGNGRWLLIIEHRTSSGYIVGNRIDITAQKQAAEALAVREAYLQATLDNLPFFFWLKDAESRFLAVNKVFAKACGRNTPQEIVGLTDFEVWPRKLAEQYVADDHAVMSSRQEKTMEEPVSGGSETGWIETYKKPVIAEDGTLLGTVGFARDISERRFAEASIRDRNEQLNTIFALSPDGFVSFDADFRVKFANRAFLRMTSLDEERIVGMGEKEFGELLANACIPTAQFPGVASLRQAKLNTRDRRCLIELAGVGKRILEVGIRTSESETVSQILYFRDVTHETEVDRLKSEFLSMAAHELRTPMASIYGFSELLLSDEDFSAEERKEFLGAIYSQAELMTSVINELLDLARIEARRGTDFNLERLEVGALLHQSVNCFKIPSGRTPPLLAKPELEYWIRADSRKIMQAIGNVLTNAYKYSPGGGDITTQLAVDEQNPAGTRIGIRISDSGIGMTPQQLARVCERFYRADASGKIPGTGLGMSIVKEIIELHGGEVELSSELGLGTTVTLWLPAIS